MVASGLYLPAHHHAHYIFLSSQISFGISWTLINIDPKSSLKKKRGGGEYKSPKHGSNSVHSNDLFLCTSFFFFFKTVHGLPFFSVNFQADQKVRDTDMTNIPFDYNSGSITTLSSTSMKHNHSFFLSIICQINPWTAFHNTTEVTISSSMFVSEAKWSFFLSNSICPQ